MNVTWRMHGHLQGGYAMQKNSTLRWYLLFGIFLVVLSALLYMLHYAIFRDPHHIFIYFLGDVAFIPIEVLAVTIIIHQLLEMKEKKLLREKMNMLVGVFFSEMGTRLLSLLSAVDGNVEMLRKKLGVNREWTDEAYDEVMKELGEHIYQLHVKKDTIEVLKRFLLEKREFVVRLLENPYLIEREDFTELLRAILHLIEEYDSRKSLDSLPDTDMNHLTKDAERVYGYLIREWIAYMQYLKIHYPYLFSLAVRTNPFDIGASPIIYE